MQTAGPAGLGALPASTTYRLCDQAQLTPPLRHRAGSTQDLGLRRKGAHRLKGPALRQ